MGISDRMLFSSGHCLFTRVAVAAGRADWSWQLFHWRQCLHTAGRRRCGSAAVKLAAPRVTHRLGHFFGRRICVSWWSFRAAAAVVACSAAIIKEECAQLITTDHQSSASFQGGRRGGSLSSNPHHHDADDEGQAFLKKNKISVPRSVLNKKF